ncbi:MAG: riboflavin synthase, partial [Elusimicrobiota bacterium]
MFQGIVVTAGRVLNLKDRVLEIAPGRALKTRPGSSVAVNGVCLTVVRRRAGRLIFDLGQETLEKTDLGRLKKGGLVNLETPLRLADGIDGHIVL